MHALWQSVQDCRPARRLARKNMDSVTFPSTPRFAELDTHHIRVDTIPSLDGSIYSIYEDAWIFCRRKKLQ
jgi:hypothetical protein